MLLILKTSISKNTKHLLRILHDTYVLFQCILLLYYNTLLLSHSTLLLSHDTPCLDYDTPCLDHDIPYLDYDILAPFLVLTLNIDTCVLPLGIDAHVLSLSIDTILLISNALLGLIAIKSLYSIPNMKRRHMWPNDCNY